MPMKLAPLEIPSIVTTNGLEWFFGALLRCQMNRIKVLTMCLYLCCLVSLGVYAQCELELVACQVLFCPDLQD